MTRVLVTGGTGFIGRHLVERLVKRGDRVRCLIRRPFQQGFFDPLDVDCVRGDVLVPKSLGPALQDVDVVYHLAGRTLVLSPQEYVANGQGSRALAQACAGLTNPPVVVYVSSLAAAGPAADDRSLTEASLPRPVSAYGRSKLEGEQQFRAVADTVPVTIIRPPSVFGPWDANTLWLFRTVRWHVNFVPGRSASRLSWIYVSDLVEALLLAAERGMRLVRTESGPESERGIYFAALDEWPTLAEVGALAAQALDCRLWHTFHMPGPVCQLYARCNDVLARLIRRPILLSHDKITEGLAGSWLCSAEKAKRELGFVCRIGLAEGFRRTAAWYRDQGWL